MTGEARHTYRFAPWLIIASVGFAVVVTVLLDVVVEVPGWFHLFVPVLTAGAMWLVPVLEITPSGIEAIGRRAAWDGLELRPGVWSTKLVTLDGTPVRRRLVVTLGFYDTDWERGPIGDDLRRWAPALLPDDPPVA